MGFITKEIIRNDGRFYIDDRNIERLMQTPIIRYDVKFKKVGMLLRTRANSNRVVNLDQTRVYAYLTGTQEGKKEYDEYIRICNVPFRNRDVYNDLIEEMSRNPYDIKRGAIVIDQNGFIYDGQHRSCYLLYKYGPNYRVEVLQLTYKRKENWMSRFIFCFILLPAEFRAMWLCLTDKIRRLWNEIQVCIG